MDIQQVFECFASLLEERQRAGVFTTEDSLRYTFFLALVETGFCRHTEIILEEPHPTIPAAEIDLRIMSGKECLSTAFEFKFDRAISSQRNLPRTQKAGAVFKDLFRLARIPTDIAPVRYFIYFTSHEMADYFKNPINRVTGFYNLPTGNRYPLSLDFVNSLSATFQATVGGLVIPCEIVGAYQQEYKTGYSLRIFKVIS